LEDALLLEQKLTENKHPDHTLITYPGLGHYFYPEDYWSIAMGPMQETVLQDLEDWLKSPERNIQSLNARLETATNKVNDLQGQVAELKSELAQQTSELETQLEEFQFTMDSSRTLAYIAILIALIAVAAVIVLKYRR
jgi:uncharacterized coiled-coil protein SlyX